MLLRKLYEFKWYEIPPKYQKMVGAAIYSHRFSGVIRMGPFDALNYETSSNVGIRFNSLFLKVINFYFS